jgi:hypothetical protein
LELPTQSDWLRAFLRAKALVEAIGARFKVIDSTGQSLAYVYGYSNPRDAGVANALTLDEARRIASNIAKLPTYSAGSP